MNKRATQSLKLQKALGQRGGGLLSPPPPSSKPWMHVI